MADSCATCAFYLSGPSTCNIAPPSVVDGTTYVWPVVQPSNWCASWGCWPGAHPTPSTVSCTSGTTAPSGGSDGDYYVLYTLLIKFGDPTVITALSILQKQVGSWVTIATIL